MTEAAASVASMVDTPLVVNNNYSIPLHGRIEGKGRSVW